MGSAAQFPGFISSAGLISLFDVAAAFGANREVLAREAHIDLNLLSVPGAEVAYENYAALSKLLLNHVSTADIGLYIGRAYFLEHIHLDLYLASVSLNLRSWLNMVPSVANLFGDIGCFSLQRQSDKVLLQWLPKQEPDSVRCTIADSMLCSAALQMDAFCLVPVKPLRVDLSYPKPDNTSVLSDMLGTNLHFNQPFSTLYYERSVLDTPLVHVSTRYYDRVAEEFSQVFSDDGSVTDPFSLSLHAAIRQQLPAGDCSVELIAGKLNVSRRTLQRRLNDRGTNFQQLLQGIKLTLAKKYLDDDRLSIIEIAFLLGYGDHSTFSAAFKSWTRITPSEYRGRKVDQQG